MTLHRALSALDRRPAFAAIPWHWRCYVRAPDGERIAWSEGHSVPSAISNALEGRMHLWPFALTQGYRIEWVMEDREC